MQFPLPEAIAAATERRFVLVAHPSPGCSSLHPCDSCWVPGIYAAVPAPSCGLRAGPSRAARLVSGEEKPAGC